MRIAQIAPLYERVPPQGYGGTERIVSYLTEELVRRGHQVTLFASGDSLTRARLWSPCPRALRPAGVKDPMVYTAMSLGEVFEHADAFDLIHSHVDYLAFPFIRLTDTPVVHTQHGRLDLPDLPAIFAQYPEAAQISISDAQRAPLPHANWVATVHHGLPRDLYAFRDRPENYLLFLGRIAPEKRPDWAVAVARRAGIPLKIAAKVDAVDRLYFEREIAPLLEHPLVEFLGEVDDAAKQELLGSALALLFPIDWPEPFGLVMIEALACGTPVIARPCGAVPEIIEHGRTGLLGWTVDALAAHVRQVERLDRAVCRRVFEIRFTVEAMVDRYEAAYAKVLEKPTRYHSTPVAA